jgi:hypothetical protein
LMNKGDEALKRLATSALRHKADLAPPLVNVRYWTA